MKLKKIVTALVLLSLLASVSFGCVRKIETNEPQQDYTGNRVTETEYEGSFTDLSAVYQSVSDSVVTIVRQPNGVIGSGFIVDSENGYIVTSSSLLNETVIQQNFQIILHDGTKLEAQITNSDRISGGIFQGRSMANSDILLLRIDTGANVLPAPVSFVSGKSLDFGDICFTVGSVSDNEDTLSAVMMQNIITNPRNTHAIAFEQKSGDSFFDGSFEYLIQTGITLNSGNAGSPLFNQKGEVVGMMNIRAEQTTAYANSDAFGISFATPSEVICSFLQENTIDYSLHSSEEVTFDSIIENTSSLRPATDRVAEALMSGENGQESDYFVVDGSCDVVLKKESESTQQLTEKRIYDNNTNKTVKIVVYYETKSLFGESTAALSEGSGFLIGSDGYIMTNLHVINKLASQNQSNGQSANSTVDISDISVYAAFEQGTITEESFFNKSTKFVLFPMQVVAYHKTGDLAVLRFANPMYYTNTDGNVLSGFESICNFETETPCAGSSVVAIGNALGYGISVSTGVISDPEFSAYESLYGYKMLQTDCPINSGNSGGPLFNEAGDVVGVNTLGLNTDDLQGYENVSWSIPASFASNFIAQLNEHATVSNIVYVSPFTKI